MATVPTGTLTKPDNYDPTNDIAILKEAQKKQAMAQLASQRNNTLSSLGAEQTKISNDANDMRNSTNTTSQLQAKNFAEYMASRGQNNATGMNGTNAQAEISRNVALQGAIGGINRNEQLGLQDISRRKTLADDTYNSGITEADANIEAQATQLLMNAKQQKYQNELSQYNADRTYDYGVGRDTIADERYTQERTDRGNELQGYVTDPATGKLVKTSAQKEIDTRNELAAKEKEKTEYINTINQYYGDFQSEINKITGDGDPTNDWKISYLKSAQQQKKDAMLQNDIQTIGQYSGDYQAEIDRRTAANPNDPLLPYLKIAQVEKKAAIKNAQLSEKEKNIKLASDLWETVGVANEFISKALGVPVGTKTLKYSTDQASISRDAATGRAALINANTNAAEFEWKKSNPAANLTATEKKNQSFSQDYADLKALPVAEVVKELTKNQKAYLNSYGPDGFKQLWNTVLADAIEKGQAPEK